MASVTSFPEVPRLTQIERIGPKGYLRYVFNFALPEDYDLKAVAAALQTGYDATKERMGILRCEAMPDPDAGQEGVFKPVEMPADDEIDKITVKDLRKTFGQTHAQLRDKGFPVSAFEADVVMRRGVWPQPGERLPISLLQANFIEGGLVLTWCILHVFGDGTTFHQWMRIWAEEVRKAEGVEITEPLVFDSAMWTDREQIMKPSGKNAGRPEDHPEYTVLPFTPPGMPPKMLSDAHRGKVFYFSPEALKELKAEADPKTKALQDIGGQDWVSTNDALSALLWRTVMSVQHGHMLDQLEGDPVSVFNVAIDGRQRTNPAVHPATLGCFLEYVAASASVRDMLDPAKTSVADLAVLIRKAVARATKEHTDDVMTLAAKLEDVNRLVPTAFLDVPGFHCIQTSWVGFELYGLEWGPRLGKVEAVRSPHVGVINGLQVVFPILPDGGWEVLVGVEESCLDRLMEEPLWNKFAKAK